MTLAGVVGAMANKRCASAGFTSSQKTRALGNGGFRRRPGCRELGILPARRRLLLPQLQNKLRLASFQFRDRVSVLSLIEATRG